MRVLLFIAALIICAPAFAQDESGFRGMIWGVTKADVQKFEKAKPYKEEPSKLYFLEKPDEFRRLITYDFTDGKLTGGKFEYVELNEPSPQAIMDMFGDKQIAFEKIYGETSSQEFIWKSKKYLYYPQFWPRALQSGDLRLRAVWQTTDTLVTLETYYDGLFYQFYYTAVAAAQGAAQKDGITLDLPKGADDTKKQP